MSQTLRTQFNSIVSMDEYRRQNSFDLPQSQLKQQALL